jgi:hypothetical protein
MKEETDRYRHHTAKAVLERIDGITDESLRQNAVTGDRATAARIAELDREWDVDRLLETEASLTALAGLALGATVNRKFFVIPGFVASMVLLEALTGWYPLLPLFRRLGVRTSREIERERYALKALRGDFDNLDRLPADDAAALDSAALEPSAQPLHRLDDRAYKGAGARANS